MKPLLVKFGFLLMILLATKAGVAQFVQEKAIRPNEPDEDSRQKMQIEVFNGVTREGMKADVLVKGLSTKGTTKLEAITDTTLDIKNYRLYTVSCVQKGFMYYAHKFWPDESKIHIEPVKMMPLAIGLKADIQDITFMGDETEIYHKSKPALAELIEFLEINPTVTICIIGHVNGPDRKIGDSFCEKASEKRARAVRDYLIQNGIAPERLTTRGAGNTEMVFPDPKTDWQTEANRRVQIEVIGL